MRKNIKSNKFINIHKNYEVQIHVEKEIIRFIFFKDIKITRKNA